jgi:hypothetical protein
MRLLGVEGTDGCGARVKDELHTPGLVVDHR